MIIRLVVVDPHPRIMQDDIVIYQVPEKSRAHHLLVESFTELGIEFVELSTPTRKITVEAGRKG